MPLNSRKLESFGILAATVPAIVSVLLPEPSLRDIIASESYLSQWGDFSQCAYLSPHDDFVQRLQGRVSAFGLYFL